MTVDPHFTPPPNPGDTLKRVLVIKLGALGDFIQALAAMKVVRATHPSARITLLTTPPLEAFAKACPYFDVVEADGRPRDLKGKADLIRRLRSASYDMVYDFQNNNRTAQYFAGLSGKKPLWSGAAQGASHMHRNPNRAAMHNFDRLTEQLLHAGLKPKPPGDPSGWIIGEDLSPDLRWIRPAFRDPPRLQPEFFGLYGPYALLIPGSSPEHPEKRWSADRFIALAKWFAEGGVTPAVIGGKAEGEIGNQMVRAEPRVKNLVGRTDLFQLATLAERALVAVGGDTGPMHMAAAAKAPCVCLFAQDWTVSMELELGNVWNPETRLGRAAPKGGPVAVLYSPALDRITVPDVQRACLMMAELPDTLKVTEPAKPAVEADAAADVGATADGAGEPANAGDGTSTDASMSESTLTGRDS
ncbi:MAG: glycosyltransferase family 9 protein [Hyphomonadaceae bacterium]